VTTDGERRGDFGPQKDRGLPKNRIRKPTRTFLPDFRTIIICKLIVCKQGSVYPRGIFGCCSYEA
jgi:hypothetical protein